MFYWLAEFSDKITFLNVFRYLTFRSGAAVVTAMMFVLLFGSPIWRDRVRWTLARDGLMLPSILIAALLCANLGNHYVLLVLAVTVCFVIVGAMKTTNRSQEALSDLASAVAVAVSVIAMAFGFFAYVAGNAVLSSYLRVPYLIGMGELSVICGAVVGAGLGCLWLNTPAALKKSQG